MAEEHSEGSRGIVPVPDPTVLTTSQLLREVAALQSTFNLRLTALDEKLNTQGTTLSDRMKDAETARKEAVDKASQTIQEGLNKAENQQQIALDRAQKELHLTLTAIETRVNEKFEAKDRRVDEKIDHIDGLQRVKFDGVQIQLSERDTRVVETALATRTAVDAALAAAEKARTSQAESFALAAGKAEAAFSEALKQQAQLSQTTTSALRDQIEDMKERITRIEAIAIGASTQKVEGHTSQSSTISVISISLAILGALIAVSAYLRPH